MSRFLTMRAAARRPARQFSALFLACATLLATSLPPPARGQTPATPPPAAGMSDYYLRPGWPQGTPPNVPGLNSPTLPPPPRNGTIAPLSPPSGRLASRGVYLNVTNVMEVQGVPTGGVSHGTFVTNWLIAGVDLDLERMLGIHGASLHIAVNDVAGQGRAYQFTGAAWSTMNNWAVRDGMQLKEFTWDQHLLGDRILILAGRFNMTNDVFDGSELYCQFATFLCSTPRMFITDASGPSFQSATWALRVSGHPLARLPDFYLKGAVYEDEPRLHATNHNGWPGRDWDVSYSSGVMIPYEIGYKSSFSDDRYPRQYVVGGTYDSMPYADPLYNTLGRPVALDHGRPQMHSGRSTLYFQAQQMVWRPEFKHNRGLILFATGDILTSGQAIMRGNYTIGLFDWGPFASRPADSAAIAFEVNLWNHRVIEATGLRNRVHGVAEDMSGSEGMLEANYGVHVARGVTFSPYLEYIWHPDGLNLGKPPRDLNHAMQVGFLLRVNLNQVTNFPTLQRLRY
ncbi:carbohydrate porin [Gluconacetobacter sacchari]|uniref:carbohydrate porin n=1 Tax=Gluconacetobacter sacchari TaxID=92759 RepID=UPI0039B6D74A